MKKIICPTSTHSVGCKFLDWSIHFLSGRDTVPTKQHGLLNLVNDPLTDKNAHNHLTNVPSGYQELVNYFEYLLERYDFFTIYPCTLKGAQCLINLKINSDTIDSDQIKQIQQYRQQDYNMLLTYLANQQAHIVYVQTPTEWPLYFLHSRSGAGIFKKLTVEATQEQIQEEFDQWFYKHSQQQWNQMGLKNVWDKRERRALDTRPFEIGAVEVVVPTTALTVHPKDLWYHGEDLIHSIMTYCDLSVNSQRLQAWHPIYTKWQQIQLDHLEFQLSYKNILESIVNGVSMPINLSFDQEVVIQHCLIYQYDLNLKTWQLEKFPNDTMALHQLLEPNIHSVESIY